MGKKYNNAINTSAGFKYNANSPLDDRLVVETYTDLNTLNSYSYEGIIVYVIDENRHYKYNGEAWQEFGFPGDIVKDTLTLFEWDSTDLVKGSHLPDSPLGNVYFVPLENFAIKKLKLKDFISSTFKMVQKNNETELYTTVINQQHIDISSEVGFSSESIVIYEGDKDSSFEVKGIFILNSNSFAEMGLLPGFYCLAQDDIIYTVEKQTSAIEMSDFLNLKTDSQILYNGSEIATAKTAMDKFGTVTNTNREISFSNTDSNLPPYVELDGLPLYLVHEAEMPLENYLGYKWSISSSTIPDLNMTGYITESDLSNRVEVFPDGSRVLLCSDTEFILIFESVTTIPDTDTTFKPGIYFMLVPPFMVDGGDYTLSIISPEQVKKINLEGNSSAIINDNNISLEVLNGPNIVLSKDFNKALYNDSEIATVDKVMNKFGNNVCTEAFELTASTGNLDDLTLVYSDDNNTIYRVPFDLKLTAEVLGAKLTITHSDPIDGGTISQTITTDSFTNIDGVDVLLSPNVLIVGNDGKNTPIVLIDTAILNPGIYILTSSTSSYPTTVSLKQTAKNLLDVSGFEAFTMFNNSDINLESTGNINLTGNKLLYNDKELIVKEEVNALISSNSTSFNNLLNNKITDLNSSLNNINNKITNLDTSLNSKITNLAETANTCEFTKSGAYVEIPDFIDSSQKLTINLDTPTEDVKIIGLNKISEKTIDTTQTIALKEPIYLAQFSFDRLADDEYSSSITLHYQQLDENNQILKSATATDYSHDGGQRAGILINSNFAVTHIAFECDSPITLNNCCLSTYLSSLQYVEYSETFGQLDLDSLQLHVIYLNESGDLYMSNFYGNNSSQREGQKFRVRLPQNSIYTKISTNYPSLVNLNLSYTVETSTYIDNAIDSVLKGFNLGNYLSYTLTAGNKAMISGVRKKNLLKDLFSKIENCYIPDVIDNYPVIMIGAPVGSSGGYSVFTSLNIKHLTIPDSVETIYKNAFSGCTSLESITIPDSVTSIGDYAFRGCTSLTSIKIPDSVTSIGNSAFEDCNSLTSITIPDSVTSIGKYAFSSCRSLTSITIPDSVTSIGDHAFYSCENLTSVIIGDSVTSIGDWAFLECNGLTSITIPDSITSIGEYAFYDCDSLTSITIPDSVTSIGGWAFERTNIADIYYGGSISDWEKLSSGVVLTVKDVTIHYNQELATKEYVDSQVSNLDSKVNTLTSTGLKREIVTELPNVLDSAENTIYMVGPRKKILSTEIPDFIDINFDFPWQKGYSGYFNYFSQTDMYKYVLSNDYGRIRVDFSSARKAFEALGPSITSTAYVEFDPVNNVFTKFIVYDTSENETGDNVYDEYLLMPNRSSYESISYTGPKFSGTYRGKIAFIGTDGDVAPNHYTLSFYTEDNSITFYVNNDQGAVLKQNIKLYDVVTITFADNGAQVFNITVDKSKFENIGSTVTDLASKMDTFGSVVDNKVVLGKDINTLQFTTKDGYESGSIYYSDTGSELVLSNYGIKASASYVTMGDTTQLTGLRAPSTDTDAVPRGWANNTYMAKLGGIENYSDDQGNPRSQLKLGSEGTYTGLNKISNQADSSSITFDTDLLLSASGKVVLTGTKRYIPEKVYSIKSVGGSGNTIDALYTVQSCSYNESMDSWSINFISAGDLPGGGFGFKLNSTDFTGLAEGSVISLSGNAFNYDTNIDMTVYSLQQDGTTVTGVAIPEVESDAANKIYVDTSISERTTQVHFITWEDDD